MQKSGRVERIVEAHKGAVLVILWNHDGASLLTAGEDGLLKIWTRSGVLRSTAAQTGNPIYSADWSPLSTSIIYSSGRNTVILPLTTKKVLAWHQ